MAVWFALGTKYYQEAVELRVDITVAGHVMRT